MSSQDIGKINIDRRKVERMGLFNLFKGKPKNNSGSDKQISFSLDMGKEKKRSVRFKTLNEQLDYIKDNCEAIGESNRQIEDAKVEYQAVTSYLADIQKIDLIPLEQRGRLEEAAKNIITLAKEREKYQKKSNSILTDQQFHIFERNELQIPKELPQLKENEQLRDAIEQDQNHLENERMALEDDQEDIISKQSFLKGIAIVVSLMVVFLFTLFVMLTNKTGNDYVIPFCMTVIMGIAAAFYIFTEGRKNEAGINVVKLKQKRLVTLLNKVTIKSVNNLNYLEYTYHKYMVGSFEEFKNLWEEYKKIKEEASKYQKNTDTLEFYNKDMVHVLKKYGITDCEIWILQASAIIDKNEMAEMRDRLNERRQKLRERIDIIIAQKGEFLCEIKRTMSNYPECREEGDKIVKRFQIEIEDFER